MINTNSKLIYYKLINFTGLSFYFSFSITCVIETSQCSNLNFNRVRVKVIFIKLTLNEGMRSGACQIVFVKNEAPIPYLYPCTYI